MTSVRLHDINEFMSDSDVMITFEKVTQDFVTSYVGETILRSGVEIDIESLNIQRQLLGPGSLNVDLIIYGFLSPTTTTESDLIFQTAALNGFVRHYSEYEELLKSSHVFFEGLTVLGDVSFLEGEMNAEDNDSGDDSSFLTVTSKSLTIVLVVGVLVVILGFATIRYSRKDLQRRSWPEEDLERGSSKVPTHCLADDSNVSDRYVMFPLFNSF